MDMHHIGEHKVEFHGNSNEAHLFLAHPENSHVANHYLEIAKKEGKADFFADGKHFVMTHQAGEDGKSNFSVQEHHH
jgi:hypothetical protein